MALSTDGFTLLTTIKLPSGVGGHGDWLSYDPYNQTIWLAQSPDNNEVVINTADNQIAAVIPGVGSANGSAETPDDAFLTNTISNTTEEVSTGTYALVGTTAQTGTTPDGVTYVPQANSVFVASDDNNVLDELSASPPFAQTTSYPLIAADAAAGPDVATYINGLIYIPDGTQVAAIDPLSGSILAAPALVTTGSVKPGVYDPVTNDFLFGTTNDEIVIVSGTSAPGGIGNVIGTIAIPGATDQAAIDTGAGLAFFGDKAGEVDIVDLATMQLVGTLPAEKNMHTLAVNPVTHDLYVYENNGNVVDVWNYGSIVAGSTTTATPNASGLVQLGSIESQTATVWDVNNVVTISAGGSIINAGSADQIAFADGTLDVGSNSPGAQVVRLYETVLGRAPDTGGLVAWSDDISAGGNATAVAQGMLSSAEGQSKLPSSMSNTAFVTALYQNGLGRAPDPTGLSTFTTLLNNGVSRAAVAADIAASTEAANDWASVPTSGDTAPVTATNLGEWLPNAAAVEVENVYYTALNRAPDAQGLAAYTNALESGSQTLQQIVNDMVDSQEFLKNFGSLIPSVSSSGMAFSTAGTAFVTQLYEDALGRTPDATGLAGWSSQSVGSVVLGVSESAERLAMNIGNQGIAVTS